MGWVYNLHTPDPNSEVTRVIAICLVFSITAFLAVCLRFFVRLRTKRTPWIDDYAVLASSILTLTYAGITIARGSTRRLAEIMYTDVQQRQDGARD